MTIEQFKKAKAAIDGVVHHTKLVQSNYFSKTSGNTVYFKPENMQITGAYKIRGAYYKISTLTEEQKSRGLVTASAGNHAQGVAYAAQKVGVPATIVMPTATPVVKVNNTKALGATVLLYGRVFDEAAEKAAELSRDQGLTFVHPFTDLDVATGQGTLAAEILQDLPDVDVILVPIGGGGLIAGVSSFVKMVKPSVQIIGVEPTGAASMKASLDAGKVTPLETAMTIADGVAVKTVGDKVFPIVQKNVEKVITIDDEELVQAFLDMLEKHKMLVENAGLVTVAALNHLDFKGKKVVSILSGGNMDVLTMSTLVNHGLIHRGRLFSFVVELPDRPGELQHISEVLAQVGANVVKLDHNQFSHLNRLQGVELTVTVEAFGPEHKEEIMLALQSKGYHAVETETKG